MPSTVIRSFQYNASDKALTILFITGIKYRYTNVPPAIYENLRNSFSKGQYFNAYIKNNFPYERLDNVGYENEDPDSFC